ncbi:MinD/ParA family protein [uncultured Microbacterium sp.]|uniref:nucleotide-binding protein n=1 Tax=uncultured Microbacterium sp. TaxID=191216 RepID=UPI002628BCCE|nr:MinD/ParA family protein [uncultured Microbacterium sp.]
MTPKNIVDPDGDDSLGVLDDTASSDTIAIGPHDGTAQVSVTLPTGGDDDDLVDDEVVGGEVVSDLIIDTSAVADDEVLARIRQEKPEIIIELPAEEVPVDVEAAETAAEPAVAVAEVVDEQETPVAEPAADAADAEDGGVEDAVVVPATGAVPTADEKDAPAERDTAAHRTAAVAPDPDALTHSAMKKPGRAKKKHAAKKAAVAAESAAPEPVAPAPVSSEPVSSEPVSSGEPAAPEPRDPVAAGSEAPPASETQPAAAAGLSELESAVAAAKAQLREAMSPASRTASEESRARRAPTSEEKTTVAADDRAPASRPAAELAHRTADHEHPAEVTLVSKRIDDLGDSGRESADLLTADRLLDPAHLTRPEPEGAWSHLLYAASGGRINIGDGRKARERKALRARIAAPMSGDARFVPVLSRKGGVGKTTITALLGMALADAREDRVIAVDANPDRGTLAERIVGGHTKSVRDLVRAQHDIRGFHDLSALVARDQTRLDVLASDADPHVSEAFGDADYRDVATVAAQYYSLVLTDSGTGIVHSVMGATLDLADRIVVVSGLSVDEARLASETLTWLETNGYAQLAREAIVVLNQSTPGTPLVRLGELESHFSTRAAHVLRLPYDPQIAGGGAIDFAGLQPQTRRAVREIAAVLVEGLRAKAA